MFNEIVYCLFFTSCNPAPVSKFNETTLESVTLSSTTLRPLLNTKFALAVKVLSTSVLCTILCPALKLSNHCCTVVVIPSLKTASMSAAVIVILPFTSGPLLLTVVTEPPIPPLPPDN